MEYLRRKEHHTSAMAAGAGLRHPVEAVGRGCAPRLPPTRLVVILDRLE